MINQDRDFRLKKLCKIIALCSAAVPMPEWPPFIVEADSYLQKYYFAHMYNLIKKGQRMNVSWENIGAVLYPSRVSQIMHSIYGLSASGLNDYEKRDLVDSLLHIIETKRKDMFCEDGTNILIDSNEETAIISKAKLTYKLDDKDWSKRSQLLSRMNALLFSLCDLIHVCQHAASHEFHGIYNLKDSRFIMREYYDLKPIEVWPALEKLTIEDFYTIEIYQNVDIKFSFFNHIISSTSLPSNLVGVGVSKNSDGSDNYSIEELEEKYCELKSVMETISKETTSFNKEEWMRKYIVMHYYALKPLAMLVDEDWHPCKEQLDIISKQPDMRAASVFHVLIGLSYNERVVALEKLYNGFLF